MRTRIDAPVVWLSVTVALLVCAPARGQDAGVDAGVRDAGAVEDAGFPVVLLPFQTSWRYRVGDSSPPSDWMQPSYDDERWKAQRAPIGYGEPEVSAPLPGNPLSFYVRTRFELHVAPSQVSRLSAQLDYDDGFVLFLNGREVLRRNLPNGQTNATVASAAHESGTPVGFDLSASRELLVRGENSLAVEIHNEGGTSNDAFLDLELRADLAHVPPPVLRNLNPALGAAEVPSDAGISFEVLDHAGVASGQIQLSVQGERVEVLVDGLEQRRYVSFAPERPFAPGGAVAIEVRANNLAGVEMEPFAWTFRVASRDGGIEEAAGCACGGTAGGPPAAWLLALLAVLPLFAGVSRARCAGARAPKAQGR